MKSAFTKCFFTLCTALVFWSCTAQESAESGGTEGGAAAETTIAVIPKGTTHEFWKAVEAGAKDAAAELGDVEVIWKGPLKEDDREAQIQVVEDFITQQVDGIILAPLDDVALRAPVENATRSEIPVIIFDSDLKSESYVSFVATDNYKGGEIAGERMAGILGGEGKVLMLRYQEGSASTHNREEGFVNAINQHDGIEIVSDNQYGGATTESAYQASENLLARFTDGEGNLTVDGIFTPNESTTFGMLRALQEAGIAGEVKFVGFDSSKKLLDALHAGEINGLVVQNPYKMGYESVSLMKQHLGGQAVGKRVDTGATLVTADNVDTEKIQAILHPAHK